MHLEQLTANCERQFSADLIEQAQRLRPSDFRNEYLIPKILQVREVLSVGLANPKLSIGFAERPNKKWVSCDAPGKLRDRLLRLGFDLPPS